MIELARIEVDGLPAPQGSKKYVGHHVTRRSKGKAVAVMAESAARTLKPWRRAVRDSAAVEARRVGTLDGALALYVTFYLPRPSGLPKTRDSLPTKKPDLSKLVRAVEDSLTDAGLIADDARITDAHAFKRYVGTDRFPAARMTPGAVIWLGPAV